MTRPQPLPLQLSWTLPVVRIPLPHVRKKFLNKAMK